MKYLLQIVLLVLWSFEATAGDQRWTEKSFKRVAETNDDIFVADIVSVSEKYFVEGKEISKKRADNYFHDILEGKPTNDGVIHEIEEIEVPMVEVRISAKLVIRTVLKGSLRENAKLTYEWTDAHMSMCPHPKTSITRGKKQAIWYTSRTDTKSGISAMRFAQLSKLKKVLENKPLHPNEAGPLPRPASSDEW